jgi:glycine/D-amino acid oxidase-like deaminating enzyme
MTPDGNPILDKTDIQGFYIVGGMCGHGFMLGPEIGSLAADFIAEGKTSYDISTFALKRDYTSKEVMK